MNRRHYVVIAVLGLAAGVTPSARATDVGMPIYSSAIGKQGNIELYYEQYNRKIKMTSGEDEMTGDQEENRFMARLNYHASSRAALHIEVGATEAKDSEGAVPVFGAGLKIKIYDRPSLNVNGFFSGTYINSIEYSDKGYVDYYRPGYVWVDMPDFKQTESYMEINGGLMISKFIKLDEKTTCTPYGGFMVSKLSGDEKYEAFYHVNDQTESESGDIEDDGLFSLFGGVGLTLDDTWGIRFEGRFVNQTSFSVGLMYFF